MTGFHHRSASDKHHKQTTKKRAIGKSLNTPAVSSKNSDKRKTPSDRLSCPLHVAVVVFNETIADVAALWTHLTGAAFDPSRSVQVAETQQLASTRPTVVSFSQDKAGVLDICKTADVLLAVFGVAGKIDYDHAVFSERGYDLLKSLKLQGLPNLVLAGHIAIGNFNLDGPSMRNFQRYFESEFSSDHKHHRVIGDLFDSANRAKTFRSLPSADLSAWRRSVGFMQPLHSEVRDGVLAVHGWTRGLGFAAGGFVSVLGETLPFVVLRVVAEDGTLLSELVDPQQISDIRGNLEIVRPRELTDQDNAFTEDEHKLFAGEEGEGEGEGGEEEEDWGVEEEGEEEQTAQAYKVETREREEMDFPDEVDTPTTSSARVRFQKYRGVRSLRTVVWDKYEELPADFSQIWEVEQPESLMKKGLDKLRQTGATDRKIVLYLQRADAFVGGPVSLPLEGRLPGVVSTLQEHENKVTLMHVKLQRVAESMTETMKSKDEYLVQIGFRRFTVRANFSEQIKGRENDLCKYLRKVPLNDTLSSYIASFYSPVCLGQQPVLLFEKSSGRLLMWGSTFSVEASKPIILKRVLLTGYPARTHNKYAVVRYMLFNPQDILWFKPVELFTKKGLRGNITEPLGLKGHMKCRFNGVIHQDDIICLPLFKRAYPKWHPATWGETTSP